MPYTLRGMRIVKMTCRRLRGIVVDQHSGRAGVHWTLLDMPLG